MCIRPFPHWCLTFLYQKVRVFHHIYLKGPFVHTENTKLPTYHSLNVFSYYDTFSTITKSVVRSDERVTPARFLLENTSKDPIYFLDRDCWSLSLSFSLSLSLSVYTHTHTHTTHSHTQHTHTHTHHFCCDFLSLSVFLPPSLSMSQIRLKKPLPSCTVWIRDESHEVKSYQDAST